MKKSDHAEKYCPIARTLDILEDNWSILILRNASLGATRFSEFQQQLGLTRHILAARLKSFVEHGIMEKTDATGAGGRSVYVLTRKGLDLLPVLATLAGWGSKWALGEDEPPILYRHLECGRTTRPVLCCEHCGGELTAENVAPEASDTLKGRLKDVDKDEAAAMLGYPPPLG